MPPTSRFTPLAALLGGGQAATLTTAATPLSALFAVPAEASSLWLQCTSNASIEYRLDGATTGAGWLLLPANAVLPLANRPSINQLVLRAVGGNATVAVAFSYGSTGPIPPIPQVSGTGGVVPPPPPGLSAIPTPNVLHVMPAPVGNDATGAPYRQDLPYATPMAAQANAQPGDTIMVWAGDYVGENLGAAQVNWLLVGAILRDNGTDPVFSFSAQGFTVAGAGFIIADQGAPYAVDCIDTGASPVICQVPIEGGTLHALRVLNGRWIQQAPVTGYGSGILATGRVEVYGAVRSFGTACIESGTGASILVEGELVGDGQCIVCNDGSVTVRGNVTGSGSDTVVCATGTVEIQGNVTGTGNNIVFSNGGRITVFGDITGNGDVVFASGAQAATITHGDIISSASYGLYAEQGAYQEHHGDILASEYGAIAVDAGTRQLVFGDIEANRIAATCNQATQSVTGVLTSASDIGALCTTGTQAIQGRIEADLDALQCDGGGTQEFYGQVTSTTGIGANCLDGSILVHGMINSLASWGAQVVIGELRIRGRIKSCRACVAIVDSTQPYTVILGPAIDLVADGGGPCGAVGSVQTIDGNPVSVTCMGVFQNLPLGPSVTAVVQAPVTDVNVT